MKPTRELMLGEATSDVKKAGKIAGEARVKIEKETGKKVLGKNNFLQNKNRKKLK